MNFTRENPLDLLEDLPFVPLDHPQVQRSTIFDIEFELHRYIDAKHYAEAERLALSMLASDDYPFDIYARHMLRDILVADGRHTEARSLFESLKGSPDYDVQMMYLQRYDASVKRAEGIRGFAEITSELDFALA